MNWVMDTARLRLREIEFSDAAFMYELMNEKPWLDFIGDRGIRTKADARAYISDRLRPSYAEHGFGFWLTERLEDGTPLGICGLVKRDTLDDVDIGFGFRERYWGNGYAREASEAVIDFAREVAGLTCLVAISNPDNARSARLLATLGFRFERRLRLAGENFDVRLFRREL
jgi:RimJ/RimL family protein N-acetyltransferase